MRLAVITLVGLMTLGFTGCGKKNSLDTVPISGTVKLDGQPVEGASVVFAPSGGGGQAASGVTDSSGKYELTTVDPNDGALPGSYIVMISKTVASPTAMEQAVKPGMTPEEATKAAYDAKDKAGANLEPDLKEHLPAKYKTGAGGLTAEVTKGGKTEWNWDLTSDGSATKSDQPK
jgi:hypothetical protein